MTARIVSAIDNSYVTISGHPTGRLIGSRDAYDVDMDAVMKAAAERGVALELNSQPQRLDLNDVLCKRAKELGVRVAIDTDAHDADQLDLMRYGVATAQRGWLRKGDVINCAPSPPRRKL